MLKKTIKRVIEITPYTIVRKKNVSNAIKNPLEHNTPEGMNSLFSGNAFLNKYRSKHRNELYEYIGSKINKDYANLNQLKIADFGCGPGLFLEYIANKYPHAKLFGFEYSSVALDIARSNCPSASLTQHDLTQPLEKDLEFDFIVCSQTLEHIPFPNIALANIFTKVSKSNGRIVITVPDGRVDTYEGHLNFWSPESFEVWIRDYLPSEAVVEFDVLSKDSGFDYLIAIIDI